MTTRPVLVVGLSGSSGAQYGIRLLRVLHELGSREIHLVISRGAEKTLRLEAGTEPSQLYPLADHVHERDEMAASFSSGSFITDGMVVCPCSMRTLAAIATGNADSLLSTRRRRVPQGAPSVSAGDQGDAAQPHPPTQHGHRNRSRCRRTPTCSRLLPPTKHDRGSGRPDRRKSAGPIWGRASDLPTLGWSLT